MTAGKILLVGAVIVLVLGALYCAAYFTTSAQEAKLRLEATIADVLRDPQAATQAPRLTVLVQLGSNSRTAPEPFLDALPPATTIECYDYWPPGTLALAHSWDCYVKFDTGETLGVIAIWRPLFRYVRFLGPLRRPRRA